MLYEAVDAFRLPHASCFDILHQTTERGRIGYPNEDVEARYHFLPLTVGDGSNCAICVRLTPNHTLIKRPNPFSSDSS